MLTFKDSLYINNAWRNATYPFLEKLKLQAYKAFVLEKFHKGLFDYQNTHS